MRLRFLDFILIGVFAAIMLATLGDLVFALWFFWHKQQN
jgi:hypothetical protein